jgi:hypothetical protein
MGGGTDGREQNINVLVSAALCRVSKFVNLKQAAVPSVAVVIPGSARKSRTDLLTALYSMHQSHWMRSFPKRFQSRKVFHDGICCPLRAVTHPENDPVGVDLESNVPTLSILYL